MNTFARERLRSELARHAANGTLAAPAYATALELANLNTTAPGWRRFFNRLLLIGGALLMGAGVIFFVAYNWHDLGRFARFGMLEALIALATAYAFVAGLGSVKAQAALLFAVLVQGGLLALLGQTYPTGADNYELFLAWALLALPWVLAARWAPQWGLWWTLINLSLALYLYDALDPLHLLFLGHMRTAAVIVLNLAGLAMFEAAYARVAELRTRWLARYCMLLVLAAGTMAALLYLLDGGREESSIGCLLYFITLAGGAAYYQVCRRDLFPLAFGSLSLIIVVAAWLSKHLLRHDVFGNFLLIALVVIGASVGATLWLRELNRKWEASAPASAESGVVA
jgi:uncharacterized membrane protein